MQLEQLELTGGGTLTLYLRGERGGHAAFPAAPAGAGGARRRLYPRQPPGRATP